MQIMAIQSNINNKAYRNNVSNCSSNITNNVSNPSFKGEVLYYGIIDGLRSANVSERTLHAVKNLLKNEWLQLANNYNMHIVFEKPPVGDNKFAVWITAGRELPLRHIEDGCKLIVENGKGALYRMDEVTKIKDYGENIEQYFQDRLSHLEKDFQRYYEAQRARKRKGRIL